MDVLKKKKKKGEPVQCLSAAPGDWPEHQPPHSQCVDKVTVCLHVFVAVTECSILIHYWVGHDLHILSPVPAASPSSIFLTCIQPRYWYLKLSILILTWL